MSRHMCNVSWTAYVPVTDRKTILTAAIWLSVRNWQFSHVRTSVISRIDPGTKRLILSTSA